MYERNFFRFTRYHFVHCESRFFYFSHAPIVGFSRFYLDSQWPIFRGILFFIAVYKTFKYKAVCNKQTHVNALKWLELCRFLYNCALEHRRMMFRDRGKVSFYSQSKELSEIKKIFPEFKQVGAQVLENVLVRLDLAFRAFFKRVKSGRKPGYPRFKNQQAYNSFTLRQCGWKLNGKLLEIKNIGYFKLRLHRPIDGRIKIIIVRLSSTGEWFVSFVCANVPIKEFLQVKTKVGIDVGLENFCTDSDGNKFENPRFFKHQQKYLRRVQRSFSRKKKGSKNYAKSKLKVAKIYQKITNQRLDFCHKVANYYVKNYDHICIEDLKITNMVRNKYLSKAIMDAAWNIFFTLMSSKAANAEWKIIEKKNPRKSSILCSDCGTEVTKTIAIRTHKCPNCKGIKHRDYNAAINIMNFPLAKAKPLHTNDAVVKARCAEAQLLSS